MDCDNIKAIANSKERKETFLYNKKVKNNSRYNIWLAFPQIYSFGMSSLGYVSIFQSIDEKFDDVYIERVFTDSKTNLKNINDIDLIAFSVSFELDFLCIFKIMEKYKIPFKACERNESFPLIFAGGPCITANPCAFEKFFDFMLLGDGEDMNVKIVEFLKENKNLTKEETLQKLSTFEGVYVPNVSKKVNKVTSKLDKCIYTGMLSENSFFANTFIIELVRGCANRCGFCLASYLNLPVRYIDYNEIVETIDLGLQYTNKIAFLGALIAAHPKFDQICDYIYQKSNEIENLELSISSLRLDSLTPKIVQTLVKLGQKHVTVAIEAGSNRLRRVINKNLNEDEILNGVKIAIENGLKGMKFYTMIGLPTETQEDICELVNLAKKIKNLDKTFDVTFSFSTFVPKAHTPFQYCQREETKSLEKKYEYIKREFHKLGVKARCSSVKWDDVQTLISKADNSFDDYFIQVYKKGGNLGAFKSCFKECLEEKIGKSFNDFITSNPNYNDVLPWDFIKINHLIKDEKMFLVKECKRLLSIN